MANSMRDGWLFWTYKHDKDCIFACKEGALFERPASGGRWKKSAGRTGFVDWIDAPSDTPQASTGMLKKAIHKFCEMFAKAEE